ncbi:hypothetical protein NH14_001395 [Paraburkholderia sacchari]|uniref:Uncharacterized protein n=1 Tax=Paraburkholderia sacchari TaxID=159450 RepID=A0A8T6Z438_9BURK|nr:hypothetical protein [Paraburkholderia sacchari]
MNLSASRCSSVQRPLNLSSISKMKGLEKILLSLQNTFIYNSITCRDLHYLAHDSARQALSGGFFFAFSASIQSFQKAFSSMSLIGGNTETAFS